MTAPPRNPWPLRPRVVVALGLTALALSATGCTGSSPSATPTTTRSTAGSAPATSASTAPGTTPAGGTGSTVPGETTLPGPNPILAPARDAYEAAYTGRCEALWSISSDGVLVDPDDPAVEHRVDECLVDLDPGLGEDARSLAEAAELGRLDANRVVATLTSSGRLCVRDTDDCVSV